MPINSLSRYRNLSPLSVKTARRGESLSLPIRRQPIYWSLEVDTKHQYTDFDTADLLAAKYFGREQFYWFLLDANQGKLPEDFELGEVLDIPVFSTLTRITRRGR